MTTEALSNLKNEMASETITLPAAVNGKRLSDALRGKDDGYFDEVMAQSDEIANRRARFRWSEPKVDHSSAEIPDNVVEIKSFKRRTCPELLE